VEIFCRHPALIKKFLYCSEFWNVCRVTLEQTGSAKMREASKPAVLKDLKEQLLSLLTETDENLGVQDLLHLLNAARKARDERKRRQEEEAQAKIAASVRRRDLPSDWRNAFADDARSQGVRAESAGDGLLLSLRNLNRVDIEYIAEITGLSCSDALHALGSAVYQNPDSFDACFYKGWETADEYLSGAVFTKLQAAREAARRWPGLFERNIDALEAVLPAPVPASGIYASLGSPWIPPRIIADFAVHLFGKPPYCNVEGLVSHDPVLHTWRVQKNVYGEGGAALTSTYGSPSCNGLKLLEKTLNNSKLDDKDISLKAKQTKMRQAFDDWVFADAGRRELLQSIYNKKFGYRRKRRYDGSFLRFPGLSREIALRPHQKNAVARILFSGNTLLGHEVGAGKTFIMIAAAMELRRTGRSRKNLFIVPNHIVRQWRDMFLRAYPAATLLCVEPGNFTPKRRQATLAELRDGDHDGIIMAYSCAEQIPLSVEWRKKRIDEALTEVKERLDDTATVQRGGLEKVRGKLEGAMAKLLGDLESIFSNIAFDMLGIGAVFLDEAHNYKNIPLEGAKNIQGINAAGSKKCADMLARIHAVRDAGGIAVLSTGTPIANSFADVFVLQQYLQPGALRFCNVQYFPAWAATFAESRDSFEVDVDAQRFRTVQRFVRFHNLPELSAVFGQVAEFSAERFWDIPTCAQRQDQIVPKSPELAQYLQSLSDRVDQVRGNSVNRKADNLLKITTDGRKAALDLRLVQGPPSSSGAGGMSQAPLFALPSKAERCAQTVFALWQKHAARKNAQVIFCDLSVPQQGFNVYAEVKDLLLRRGVPEHEIAFVHDHDTPSRRAPLYARVRAGEVRVLLGSTFKLGMGVNIQDKLVGLHHLDVPWRPADMVQREGRILREGNENREVHICRYVTEGSFDAYSWQILERKQRFIAQFLGGELSHRSGAELDDAALSYAEIKALAVGDPLLRERTEAAIETERLSLLRRRWLEEQEGLRLELLALPERLAQQQEKEQRILADHEDYRAMWLKQKPKQRRELGERILQGQQAHAGMAEEKILFTYQGFQVVLPARMHTDKPGVLLASRERYAVEIGNNASGCIIRMDNMLDALPELAAKCAQEAAKLGARVSELEKVLQTPDPYKKDLVRAEGRLRALDKKLQKEGKL
jgi:N12 class adenine-specific DNA methylase